MAYTIKLKFESETCCRGSIVRLPDGVEASFSHTEGLLVLLEGMGGPRWWRENQARIEERILSFAATYPANALANAQRL